MIQQTAPIRITDNRISIVVENSTKPKKLTDAAPEGMSLWCKPIGFAIVVPYADLMRLPAFRAGVLAVLESERVAQSERRE